MPKSLRVCVFIDGQNCYRDARRAFHDEENDPSSYGQVSPRLLAELLTSKGPGSGPDRVLDKVIVYVGEPSPNKQGKAHGAHSKQRAAWLADGVIVKKRPLWYPPEWPAQNPQEKGIDVALAVDFVFNAARRNYDVGIMVSTDTDLLPALEAACEIRRAWGKPYIEVSMWAPNKKRLSLKKETVWCHKLGLDDYETVRDKTNYTPKP